MNSLAGRELALGFLLSVFVISQGCSHKIRVTPVPPLVSSTPIPQSVLVQVPSLAIEGSDHMPGITLLDWPAKNLRSALMDYAKQRQTFDTVSDEQGDLTLSVRAWLWMRSRENYRYIIHLESDLGPTGKPPTKSYVVEKEAVGSYVRWVTASDQAPIGEAVQAALDDLFLQIEEDATLFGRR